MLVDAYQSFMDFIAVSLEYWSDVLSVVKIIAGIMSVLFLGIIIFSLRKSSYIKFKYGYDFSDFLMKKPAARRKVEKDWSDVEKKMASFNDSDWKLAILDVDKLVDDLMKNLGAKGTTFGERLENLPPGLIKNIDILWQAHKVRNNIVHDPDYRLSHERAQEVLGYYEQVLREFEAI